MQVGIPDCSFIYKRSPSSTILSCLGSSKGLQDFQIFPPFFFWLQLYSIPYRMKPDVKWLRSAPTWLQYWDEGLWFGFNGCLGNKDRVKLDSGRLKGDAIFFCLGMFLEVHHCWIREVHTKPQWGIWWGLMRCLACFWIPSFFPDYYDQLIYKIHR